jgi:hypothetical protein
MAGDKQRPVFVLVVIAFSSGGAGAGEKVVKSRTRWQNIALRYSGAKSKGSRMSPVSMLGTVVIVVGAGLWIGNVTRMFPTFPLAGYLTMAVGGIIVKAGKR